jgi:hypothetical protein
MENLSLGLSADVRRIGVLVSVAIAIGILIWLVIRYEASCSLQSQPLSSLSELKGAMDGVLGRLGRKVEYRLVEDRERSYTTEKKNVHLCIRDRGGNPYEYNTLIFVALHELSHVMTREKEVHGPEFKRNFGELLRVAEEMRVYDPKMPFDERYPR